MSDLTNLIAILIVLYRKKFTWFDHSNVLTCPVAHLVALTISDEAFKMPSLRTVGIVFSLTLPQGQNQLVLHWKDACLERPILRTNSGTALDAELTDNTAAKCLRSLGENMGYREPLTWYCLRRLVLSVVDGSLSPQFVSLPYVS